MAIIVLDVEKFRKLMPAYADQVKWPDELIKVYWDQAICIASDEDCGCNGNCTELQLFLMTAHLLKLHTNVMRGKQGGLVSSSSVDKVSVSMVTPPVGDTFDWWLNQTPYGQQLLAMLLSNLVGGFGVGGLPERKAFRKVGGTFQ